MARIRLDPCETARRLRSAFAPYLLRMRLGNWKWCVPKEKWGRYASLPTSASRSDNQQSPFSVASALALGEIRSHFGQVLSEEAVLIDMETSLTTCYPQHVHIHRARRFAALIR
jgi:hypothetical protein